MTDRELMQMALDALEAEHSAIYGTSQTARAIKALRARLAQPEQEPVAKYSDIISDGGLDPRNKFDTAPPQREWQGLTDEEQGQVAWACGAMSADWLEFARAIEAKLKEKNG